VRVGWEWRAVVDRERQRPGKGLLEAGDLSIESKNHSVELGEVGLMRD
jgi:hypothetical protein